MAPKGRQVLRFAYRDAERLADTLTSVGRFKAEDVTVLRDPTREVLLSSLDAAVKQSHAGPKQETMLLFYYSGHADVNALYPGGVAVPMADIKARLDQSGASVRVGVLDACRGGGWTGAKSLAPDAPFEIPVALGLRNEGSVFIASSSGVEDAHESEALEGSFFTHHLVAGMRGAADSSGDGEITLNEAYRYAQALTVRDTAIAATQPQHPSFEMHLAGRSDLPIAEVQDAPSSLALEQETGPLEVIHLGTGVIVLEVPAGVRSVRAALPPGRYMVRVRTPYGTLARSVELDAGVSALVREQDLKIVGSAALARKNVTPETATETAPDIALEQPAKPAKPVRPIGRLGTFYALMGFGGGADLYAPVPRGINFSTGATAGFSGSLALLLRPTERLTLSVGTLAAAYRFGNPDLVEVSVSGGLLGFGFGQPSVDNVDRTQLYATLGATVEVRTTFEKRIGFIGGAGMQNNSTVAQLAPPPSSSATVRYRGADTWQIGAFGGVHLRLHQKVEMNIAAMFVVTPLYEGRRANTAGEADLAIGFGSGRFGFDPLPLLRVKLNQRLSIDLHAQIMARTQPNIAEVQEVRVMAFGQALVGFSILL
jgi:hypothetical protein